MPSASFLFSAVSLFQKSYIENILGIARDKNPGSYFPVTYTESKGETKGSPEAPTPCGGVTLPPGARGHGVGPTRHPRGHCRGFVTAGVTMG